MRLTPEQYGRLPDLLQEIVDVDRQLEAVRPGSGSFGWEDALVQRDLRTRKAELAKAASEIYGHTPARGDRGPSSAGAVAA